MIRSILSPEKRFDHRWVGDAGLNRLGLHGLRMRLAAGFEAVRKLRAAGEKGDQSRRLDRDGVLVVPGFLPPPRFEAVRTEAERLVSAAAAETPYPESDLPGFRPRQDRPWGFDRFDGGTLNRFLTVGEHSPEAAAFARLPEIDLLSRAMLGRAFPPAKLWIYETIQGDERVNPDPQKVLHRDTFHGSLKFWFFLDPVGEEDGPFVYVPGSHRLTRHRRRWEASRARRAARGRSESADVDGSFRIAETELAALGLPPPRLVPVAANTLVIANVFGFHRRGDAAPGARRLALYGNNRPHPFKLR